MLNLQKCIFSRIDENAVASGSAVSQEGLALVQALGTDGEVYVTASAGSADEIFCGISYNTNLTPTQVPWVETGTIPSSAPYTIQAKYNNIVGSGGTGQIRVYADTTGELDNDTGTHPTNPDGGKFSVNYTSGLIYFNVAQAGETVTIYYQYSPTTAEVTSLYFQPGINVNAGGYFNQVGVIKPPCIIYTTEYDTSINWALATAIKTAASGQFTNQAGSGVTLAGARVIHVPDTDDATLGIDFMATA